jgi:hypothetical protein
MQEEQRRAFTGPLDVEYRTACQSPGCPGKGTEWRVGGETLFWRVGYIIPMDPTEPKIGWCPFCKRHNMMVVRAPDLPDPEEPKGFWRLPTT